MHPGLFRILLQRQVLPVRSLSPPARLHTAPFTAQDIYRDAMESGSVWKGLFYGGFASCVAETSELCPAQCLRFMLSRAVQKKDAHLGSAPCR